MRIELVAPRYLPHAGGVEVHVSQLARHLSEQNDSVEVFTHETDPSLPLVERLDGICVRRFRALASQDFAISPRG